jgi:integrase
MTTPADPFHDPILPTLEAALTAFEKLDSETSSRKAPAQIPAHALSIQCQLRSIKARRSGLAPKSLANCKSELRHLLRTAVGGGRSAFSRRSDNWVLLHDRHNREPAVWRLSRFMGFCSATSVEPEQVDESIVERFKTALAEWREVDNPEQTARTTALAWNQMVGKDPNWPQILLHVEPQHRRRWTIEPEKFPDSFRRDADLWLQRLANVDPESEDGPVRPLRPATLTLRRQQIFMAASALVLSGRPIEEITGLSALVQLDAFKTLLRHLRQRKDGKRTEALHKLAIALTSIARHWVRVEEQHLNSMRRICANFNPGETGFGSRTRQRLFQFEDKKLLAAILHLPDRLLEEAENPGIKPRVRRLLAQVAVVVEVELFAPLRALNLASLNLDTHITPITQGRETRWLVVFEGEETKNRQALRYELPPESVEKIKRAFRLYQQPSGHFFPASDGGPKAPNVLSMQVKRVIEGRLGVEFNLHLFRGLAACLQLWENENGFELARALLGDRSEAVVRRHYTAAAERQLAARAQATIQRARLRTAPLSPPRDR